MIVLLSLDTRTHNSRTDSDTQAEGKLIFNRYGDSRGMFLDNMGVKEMENNLMRTLHTGSVAYDREENYTNKFLGNIPCLRETVNRIDKEFGRYSDNLR